MKVSGKLATESELLRRGEGKTVATRTPKSESTARTPLPATALDTPACHKSSFYATCWPAAVCLPLSPSLSLCVSRWETSAHLIMKEAMLTCTPHPTPPTPNLAGRQMHACQRRRQRGSARRVQERLQGGPICTKAGSHIRHVDGFRHARLVDVRASALHTNQLSSFPQTSSSCVPTCSGCAPACRGFVFRARQCRPC